MSDPAITETLVETIEEVVEEANDAAERAAQTNELLIDAAIEGIRGERIETLERRLDEWQSSQEDSSQAIAALAMGMERLTGQVEALLTTQSIQPPSPTPNLPSEEEDGQQENQEEIPVEIVAPEAQAPEIPVAPVPKKKRHRWI